MSRFGRKKIATRHDDRERRRNDRGSVTLAGTLNTPAQTRFANLIDVSASGCQIQGRDHPKVGEFVKLRIKNFAIFATVAWREEEKCGLCFDEKLSNELMQELWQANEQPNALNMEICPQEEKNALRNRR